LTTSRLRSGAALAELGTGNRNPPTANRESYGLTTAGVGDIRRMVCRSRARFMKSPEDKSMQYTAAVVVAAIVVFMVIGMISRAFVD
jgi:hypothetical protein